MKAFVETTVLTNALLKARAERTNARAALRRYDETLVPVYAFKELKAGPLKNFVWFHNKLAVMPYLDALRALQRVSLSLARYRTSTALEALIAATEAAGVPNEWAEKYGGSVVEPVNVQGDRLRLALKRIIIRGWGQRRKVTSQVVAELSCYPDLPLTELYNRTIDVRPDKCEPIDGCALARLMASDLASVRALLAVVEAANAVAPKKEHERRARALHLLIDHGCGAIKHDECRAIGDAAFAYLSPVDATILTTNIRDIQPLADSLGKRSACP